MHLMQVTLYSHTSVVLNCTPHLMSGTSLRMLYRQISLLTLLDSVILTRMWILILIVHLTKQLTLLLLNLVRILSLKSKILTETVSSITMKRLHLFRSLKNPYYNYLITTLKSLQDLLLTSILRLRLSLKTLKLMDLWLRTQVSPTKSMINSSLITKELMVLEPLQKLRQLRV